MLLNSRNILACLIGILLVLVMPVTGMADQHLDVAAGHHIQMQVSIDGDQMPDDQHDATGGHCSSGLCIAAPVSALPYLLSLVEVARDTPAEHFHSPPVETTFKPPRPFIAV